MGGCRKNTICQYLEKMMLKTKNLIWVDLAKANVPQPALNWLIDEQSLTAKLKQKYPDFAVKVLSQSEQKPHSNEINAIGFDGKTIIREVALLGNKQAVVFARSIIPVSADTKNLRKIGSKPLGEALFNDPDIHRHGLEITHIGDIWGRRSIFISAKTKLLVCEFFLVNLYA